MDDPTKTPSSSFKSTLAKFKKFAKDCAEEALRTANNVRRSSLGSGSAHRDVKLTENSPLGQTCQSLRSNPEDDTEELSIIHEEKENEGASVISLMVNKSAQIIEKLQETTNLIEDVTETAQTTEEIVASDEDQIDDQNISEDVSGAVQEQTNLVPTDQGQTVSVAAKIELFDMLLPKPSTEQADLMEAASATEQGGSVVGKLGEGMKSVANIFNENTVGGSDSGNDEANERLMTMLEKADVSCTVIGDPSEDFAEACKIVCEFDEDSKVNAKRCEYACLAVNNLRDEVLNTAKEISNKGEREKNSNSDIINLISD